MADPDKIEEAIAVWLIDELGVRGDNAMLRARDLRRTLFYAGYVITPSDAALLQRGEEAVRDGKVHD